MFQDLDVFRAAHDPEDQDEARAQDHAAPNDDADHHDLQARLDFFPQIQVGESSELARQRRGFVFLLLFRLIFRLEGRFRRRIGLKAVALLVVRLFFVDLPGGRLGTEGLAGRSAGGRTGAGRFG